MDRFEPYVSLGLALGVGLLVGLEREHTRPTPDSGRLFLGGIRTYPLVALSGAVAMLLSRDLGPWPIVVGGATLAALLVVNYWRDSASGHAGITTEASALLTYLLGALALSGDTLGGFERRVFVVASVTVVSTMLLSAKTELRQFTARVSRDDVIAVLKFMLVAVVALPVLPNEAHGPWGVLNPFRIGMLVTLIAGVGFVGYVAIRLLGAGRGMLLTGAIGGVVSSTAVTLAAAAKSRQAPSLGGIAGLSVLVASSVMFVRLLVVLAAAEFTLFRALLLPLGAMAVTMSGGALFFALRGGKDATKETNQVDLKNPFELSAAFKFGALFIGVLLVSRWAQSTFGNTGAYVTGALAGLTDVDAISLSMANLVKTQATDVGVARTTVVLATCSNTVTKAMLSAVLGGSAMGKRVWLVSGVTLIVGLVVAVAL